MQLTETHETTHGTVRWTSWGQGSPVVFMHGTPFSSYVWRDIADGLSARHQVFVWDMLGYGQSEKRDGQDVSLGVQQAVFTDLLRLWALDRPAVIAHDYGGTVSLRTALLDGVRYGRLALIDAVTWRPWGSEFFRLVHGNPEVFTALPPTMHEALVRSYISTAAHTVLRADVHDALVAPWLGESGQPAFYRQITQADDRFSGEVEDHYGELACPVLVAWGREDRWLPTSHATRLAERIPHARLEWIDNAGHLVQEDAPGRVAGLLADFLTG